MTNGRITYHISRVLTSVIVWEIIFWTLFYFITSMLGIFGSSAGTEKVVFKYPEYLKVLFLLIPLTGLYLFNLYRYNRMAGHATKRIAGSYLAPVSSLKSFLRFFFFRNAFVLMILTMAQPVFGRKKVAGTSESMELVICLDISNSMNTRDISDEASRLDIAKRAMIQLVNNLNFPL